MASSLFTFLVRPRDFRIFSLPKYKENVCPSRRFSCSPSSHSQRHAEVGLQAQYAVQRALEPVVVDGKLDEFSWESAHQINRFERILNDYDEVLFPTRAKMLWDGDYFYFAFVCQDADMWAIYDQEDDPMWSEEVVEVFIDPDGDGKRYLELEVNPLNAVVDLLIYSVSPEWHSSQRLGHRRA